MVNPNYFDRGAAETVVNKPSKASDQPLPRRLRALRRVLGYEHANNFARDLGVAPNAYGNVEAGSSLSNKMMVAISRLCPDVTWEWLQFGEERFLTVDMRQKLRSAEAELVAETKAKTTPSRPRGKAGSARSASK